MNAVLARSTPAPRRPVPCSVEPLEGRTMLNVGGGLTNAGLKGEYFDNATLSGSPAFTRIDVRVDFNWGNASPGGSPAAPYDRVGADRFSVRWTGQVIPRFSEAYTFIASADDGVRMSIRPAGTTTYRRLFDTFSSGQGLATRRTAYRLSAGRL